MHDGIVGKTGHYGIGVAIVLRLQEGCDCRGHFHFALLDSPGFFSVVSPGRVEIVSGYSIEVPTYTHMTALCQETFVQLSFLRDASWRLDAVTQSRLPFPLDCAPARCGLVSTRES